MSNAKKLLCDLEEVIVNWDEKSSLTVANISGLSKADVDMIKLYAEVFQMTGSFSGLMNPTGKIKEVLNAYGIEDVGVFL